MKKLCFLFIAGAVFIIPCFSQNMLILGGEYNNFGFDFWRAGVGFNHRILNEYIQNDFTLNFGSIRAKETEVIETEIGRLENGQPLTIRTEIVDYPGKFFFTLKDNLYFSISGDWIGFRAGIFASFGLYGIPEFFKVFDLFFNGGGFAGIHILPNSMISVTLDVSPGYAVAFRISDDIFKPDLNDYGFSLSFSLGIRLNLDKF